MANNTSDPYSLGPSELFVGEHIGRAARIGFVVFGSVMILSAVFGNSTLIFVVIKHFLENTKRHLHDLFIINLVLDDLLTMGYCCTFLVLDLALGYHPVANQSHCTANAVILGVLFMVNVKSLVTISFNRYLHICHSKLYRRVFTLPRTVCWCLLIWPVSLLLGLPALWGGVAGTYHYNSVIRVCTYSKVGITYTKVMVMMYCIVPSLFIAYFNCAIYRFWRKAKMNTKARFPLVRTEQEQKKKRKLILKWCAGRNKQKYVPGSLDAGVSQEVQGTQRHDLNLPVCVTHKPQVVDSHIAEGRTDTLSGNVGKANLKAEQKQCILNADKSDITSGLQIEKSVMDDVSSDSDSESFHSMSNSGNDVTGNKAENQQEQTNGCIIPETEEDSPTSSELSGKTESFISDAVECVSHTHSEESTTKTETDVSKICTGSNNHGSASALVVPKHASPSSTSPSRFKPQQQVPSQPGKQQTHHQLQRLRKKSQRKEEAFVRSLLVVSIFMFVVFMPYAILIIIDPNVKQPVIAHMAVGMMVFLNNALNWVVYGAMNPAFRKGYIKYARLILNKCRRARLG